MASGKLGRRFKSILIVVALVGLVGVGLAAFRAGPAPRVVIEPGMPAIGKRTPFRIIVEEPKRGLSRIRVEVVQGENVDRVEAREYVPRPPWAFWGERTARDELTVDIGRETVDGLKEGPATVRVVANRAESWLRSPEPAVGEQTLEVRLRPPTLQVTSRHTYVAQGGSEVVVYDVGRSAVVDGVQAGDWFFPGFPLPGGSEGQRFALFSVPYDVDDHNRVRLIARDDVDNEAEQPFIDRFFAKPFGTDTIRLSESFMARVVPAILAQEPELEDRGDLLDNYLMINGELRKKNNAVLVELARASVPDFLWLGEFMPMRHAKVTSNFADRRTYVFEGENVDRQDHLGFDLASTSRAEIQAGNAGIVVLARYFGIYGNAVILDHGYGLMSLYGHLSESSVQQGDEVERGQVIGRSGQTGLAGGDHLHFTMLLQGLPVNAQEWWDDHWIHDRLKLKLGEALP
jgi:hypothetical protein